MVKGGARTASAKKAVAKGMGINIFYNVLEEINKINSWIDVNTVMYNLPEHFGGERNETCRSYFKELWRYGLIERKDGMKITPCTPENWQRGGRPLYKISNKGKELLKIPDKHRVFALAWLLVNLDNRDDFEQLHKAFITFKKREVSLSMFKASDTVGVVRDSIKAIMYGWLEPLGFIDRTNRGTFKLDNKYYEWIKSFKTMQEATPTLRSNEIKTSNLSINTVEKLKPYAPEENTKVEIPFRIKYKGNKEIKISIRCKIYPLFFNRFETPEVIKNINLKPNDDIQIIIALTFEKKKISESFKETELGIFEVVFDNGVYKGALPIIFLTTKAHLHEINLGKLFSELGYKPITFTKSDRPDMVLFPSRKEKNITKFLHNNEFKILVETTSADILSLQKVIDDLKNFKEHTTKVLKINAKRTLIVGKTISGSILTNIQKLEKTYHPFTIISMEDLEYLKQRVIEKNDNSWEKIGKILTFNGIVNRNYINSIFS